MNLALWHGLVLGCVIGLLATSFLSLTARVRGIFHVAHAATFVLAPYFLKSLWTSGSPIWVAVPLALILGASFGMIAHFCLYEPLGRAGSDSEQLLLVSIGLYIVTVSMIGIAWDDRSVLFLSDFLSVRNTVLGLAVQRVDLLVIFVSGSLILSIALAERTPYGLARRAISENPALAVAVGVRVGRVCAWSFAIGSAAAGVGGILWASLETLSPVGGFRPLLLALTAVLALPQVSLTTAGMGGIGTGLAYILAATYLSTHIADTLIFLVLLALVSLRRHAKIWSR